jgi:pyruvate dehydrogenase phosphatase
MLRYLWKPIAATTVLIGPPAGYYWYKSRQEAFELAVKAQQADGKTVMTNRSFSLLPKSTIDERIREHATCESTTRPGGIVWKYSTAQLASNDPIEDASSHQIIERDPNDHSSPGDLLFFTVMDGHGGYHTSRLLSRVLINAVALELSTLIHNPSAIIPKAGSYLGSIKSLFSPSPPPVAADPKIVAFAIQNAFTKLDKELLNAPMQILANNMDQSDLKLKTVPDLSQHPMALKTMLPAISGTGCVCFVCVAWYLLFLPGSCALMAVLDTAHRDLYVACTGDSRAVAGIWEENADRKGSWRVEVLSEDQTGRNPNELKRSESAGFCVLTIKELTKVHRIQSEHPADEAHTVIKNGRVLGGLEPSRAFGDARYKWTREVQEMSVFSYFFPK